METVRALILALVLALAAVLASAPPSAADGKPLTVVELFTSQGCSSCPPADALLAELVKRDDVLALSLHVDYWDYIGWKDPFSDAAYTRRQNTYAERFHLRYVYTPQMVVQGSEQIVGSDRDGVSKMIARHAGPPQVALSLTASADGGLAVRLPKTLLTSPATVWIATFDAEHTTEVERGENAGRRLVNANVVRGIATVGTWNGQARTLTIPRSQIAGAGREGAVVVQSADAGPILGAARITLAR